MPRANELLVKSAATGVARVWRLNARVQLKMLASGDQGVCCMTIVLPENSPAVICVLPKVCGRGAGSEGRGDDRQFRAHKGDAVAYDQRHLT